MSEHTQNETNISFQISRGQNNYKSTHRTSVPHLTMFMDMSWNVNIIGNDKSFVKTYVN